MTYQEKFNQYYYDNWGDSDQELDHSNSGKDQVENRND